MGLKARAGAMLAVAAACVAAAACGGELTGTGTGSTGGTGAHSTSGGAGVAGDAASGGSEGGSEECPGLARPPSGPVELADFGELALVAEAVSFGGDDPESAVGFDLDCAAEEPCPRAPHPNPRGIDNQVQAMLLAGGFVRDSIPLSQHVSDGAWSVLVRLRSRPDGSVDVWLMNAERDPTSTQGAALPVWRPWPEQQGALGAAPSRATVRAGHVVSEPTGSLRLPLNIEILASRPLAIEVFADIAPQDERGVRHAIVAGRMTMAEVNRSAGEITTCCRGFSCGLPPIGDLRHAAEPWQLCEDLSFGMELDLVPAVIGEPTSDRGGTPICKE